MPIQFSCAKCGKALRVPDALAGKRVRCPQCSEIQPVPAALAGDPAPEPAPPVPAPAAAAGPLPVLPGDPPAPPPSAPPPSPPAKLPPSMLANKLVAGRACPCCGKPIALGEAVNNCQECGSPHHASCWTVGEGCANAGCTASKRRPAAGPGRKSATGAAGSAPAGPTRPCPSCGEPIAETAKKCRHCGEWLDAQMKKAAAAESGEALTVAEWVFTIVLGILCLIIPCVISIVWMIQGKPKGKTMFAVLCVILVIHIALRAVLMGLAMS